MGFFFAYLSSLLLSLNGTPVDHCIPVGPFGFLPIKYICFYSSKKKKL